jgi:hypothetical protein
MCGPTRRGVILHPIGSAGCYTLFHASRIGDDPADRRRGAVAPVFAIGPAATMSFYPPAHEFYPPANERATCNDATENGPDTHVVTASPSTRRRVGAARVFHEATAVSRAVGSDRPAGRVEA